MLDEKTIRIYKTTQQRFYFWYQNRQQKFIREQRRVTRRRTQLRLRLRVKKSG